MSSTRLINLVGMPDTLWYLQIQVEANSNMSALEGLASGQVIGERWIQFLNNCEHEADGIFRAFSFACEILQLILLSPAKADVLLLLC